MDPGTGKLQFVENEAMAKKLGLVPVKRDMASGISYADLEREIAELRDDAQFDAKEIAVLKARVAEMEQEIERLRRIEAAALRVASSRRDGVVTDRGALDRLDAALEAR